MPSYRQLKEIISVDLEKKETRTATDIQVRCPICKLPYNEYDAEVYDWHIVQCDRCGTKYKYKVGE